MPRNLKEFLDDPEEVHAFTIGLCEVLAFFLPRAFRPGRDLKAILSTEYHYYMLGRGVGVFLLLFIAHIIQEAFF